jgi:hypothetical protein
VLLVIFPTALVPLPILTFHDSFAFELVGYKISFKYASFLNQYSLSMPATIYKLPVISGAISVEYFTFSIGKVVFPLALILIAGLVKIFAIAISYAMFKVSFVVASVVLDVSPFSFASSFDKLTFEVIPIIKLNRSISSGLS